MRLSNLSVNISEDDFDSGCDSAEMMSEYVLFHISCVIFLVSYLAPSCILWGKLSFHSGLTFGHFLMTILSLSLACASALFYWHSAFTLINVVQIVSLLYLAREQKFETDIEKIYIEFFHPFKISRYDNFLCLLYKCTVWSSGENSPTCSVPTSPTWSASTRASATPWRA